MSAERYYQMWIKANNPELKQMSHDELKHAQFFIKKAQVSAIDPVEQAKIKSMITWYNEILSKLEN